MKRFFDKGWLGIVTVLFFAAITMGNGRVSVVNPSLSGVDPGSFIAFVYNTETGQVYWTYGSGATMAGQPIPSAATMRNGVHEGILNKLGITGKSQRVWRGGGVVVGPNSTLEVLPPRQSLWSRGLNGVANNNDAMGIMEPRFWNRSLSNLEQTTGWQIQLSETPLTQQQLIRNNGYFKRFPNAGSLDEFTSTVRAIGRKNLITSAAEDIAPCVKHRPKLPTGGSPYRFWGRGVPAAGTIGAAFAAGAFARSYNAGMLVECDTPRSVLEGFIADPDPITTVAGNLGASLNTSAERVKASQRPSILSGPSLIISPHDAYEQGKAQQEEFAARLEALLMLPESYGTSWQEIGLQFLFH